MPGKSKIEWTDATWNPIRGCSRVSEGCRNCYAEKVAARFSQAGKPFHGLAVFKDGEARWTGEIAFAPDQLELPLHWKLPRRIFVNSMSDLFHEKVDWAHLKQIFEIIVRCPQHTFQILTKRPNQMGEWMRWFYRTHYRQMLTNVWLGVSVEDQKTADERIPLLLETPAAVRFISYEPAIAQMKLKWAWVGGGYPKLDWVICGGESGLGARPMHPAWATSMQRQCGLSKIPFFFKQWGEWAPLGQFHPPANRTFSQRIELYGYTFLKAGKKIAGRELNGKTYSEYPNQPS